MATYRFDDVEMLHLKKLARRLGVSLRELFRQADAAAAEAEQGNG